LRFGFATPSSRPRYKRGQEADNDQKRTLQSLQTAYVNKSTAPNLQRALSTDAALGLPLPHSTALAPTHLMYATAPNARFQTPFYYNHIVISDSTDGNGERFLTSYNDSMIGYDKIRV